MLTHGSIPAIGRCVTQQFSSVNTRYCCGLCYCSDLLSLPTIADSYINFRVLSGEPLTATDKRLSATTKLRAIHTRSPPKHNVNALLSLMARLKLLGRQQRSRGVS